jgi:hypothetical protein
MFEPFMSRLWAAGQAVEIRSPRLKGSLLLVLEGLRADMLPRSFLTSMLIQRRIILY